jgi:hypothetical protein
MNELPYVNTLMNKNYVVDHERAVFRFSVSCPFCEYSCHFYLDIWSVVYRMK